MIPVDASFPDIGEPPPKRAAVLAGVDYRATRWTPELLGRVMGALAAGAEALASLPGRRLQHAWTTTVEAFREPEPGSQEQALRGPLARSSGLSEAGLGVGLGYVLRGVSTSGALDLLTGGGSTARTPAVVVLSSNLPGLAVQSLLPALAERRPVLIKSASAEPFFAPAFVAALGRREPALAGAVAAVTWPGGNEPLEDAVFSRAGRIVAYGGEDTARSLEDRLGPRLVMHGSKVSVAVVGSGTVGGGGEAREKLADGLARDVAVFDQRGCLSIQEIFVLPDGDGAPSAEEASALLADSLGRALERYGRRWPPGPLPRGVAAGIRQWRDEAVMAGWRMSTLPFASGTVIVADEGGLRLSPGGRTVRIRPLGSRRELLERLRPWEGRLQGAAVAGAAALAVGEDLRSLGVTRLAPPGKLQCPDLSTWHNGGLAPLDAFRDPPASVAREPSPQLSTRSFP